MKYQFSIVIEVDEKSHIKINKVLEENKNIAKELVLSFAKSIVLSFDMKHNDNVSVTGFKMQSIEFPDEKISY